MHCDPQPIWQILQRPRETGPADTRVDRALHAARGLEENSTGGFGMTEETFALVFDQIGLSVDIQPLQVKDCCVDWNHAHLIADYQILWELCQRITAHNINPSKTRDSNSMSEK